MATSPSVPPLFRPHRCEPDQAARMRGIYADLVQEWQRLCTLPDSGHQLQKWARNEPALRGITDLPGLLDRIDEADLASTDELLLALIRLSQQGRTLAGRVVLQAMLPKLKSIASRTGGHTSDDWELHDRRQIGVATFWDVLSTYPVDRRLRRVASNLALDTLHRLTEPGRSRIEEHLIAPPNEAMEECLLERDRSGPGFADPTPASVPDAVHLDPSEAGLLEVMAWALDVDAITSNDAQLLVRVYSPAQGEEGGAAAVGAQLGLSPEAVRKRCSRARSMLIQAVREHADTPLALLDPGTNSLTSEHMTR